MPAAFVSKDGKRSQGVFTTAEEAQRALDSDPEFGALLGKVLGKGFKIRVRSLSKPGVIPDVPEHYNVAFDEVVRSRRHLKDLQRETGSVDYEPTKAQRERAEYARDRMRYEREHR